MCWRIMGETLFIFLLMLALNIAVASIRRRRLRDVVALGLVVGGAQLVKSNLFVLPALLAGQVALAANGTVRERLVRVGTFVMTVLLVSLTTPLANFLSNAHGVAALPGNAGSTFWMANNPLADGYYVHAELEPAGKAFIEAQGFAERVARADEFEKDRLYRTLGFLWIRENPGRFVVLCLRKLNNAFGLFPRAVTFEGNRTTQMVHVFSYGLIAPFAVAGMIAERRRWRDCLPLLLVVVSYVLMVIVFYGTPRFTIVVMPTLIVFASTAMTKGARHLARR